MAWRTFLAAKYKTDADAIGGEAELVWYGVGHLEGDAAARISPWIISQEATHKPLRVDSFLQQLDAAFSDPQRAQRALEWINKAKQRKTPFREFLQVFEQKLLEAGGWDFPDAIRKGYLRAAVNHQIRRYLLGQEEPVLYQAYVEQLRRTSDNIEEFVLSTSYPKRYTPEAPAQVVEEKMEWEPTPKVAAIRETERPRKRPESHPQVRRAWDKSKEKQWKRECYRCGSPDHLVARCPEKAPGRLSVVAATTLLDRGRDRTDSGSSSQSEDSGKE
jgi:hypothetical protein